MANAPIYRHIVLTGAPGSIYWSYWLQNRNCQWHVWHCVLYRHSFFVRNLL